MINNDYPTPTSTPKDSEHGHDGHEGHGGHRLMMIACCIPMLIIAGLLFATGVAGSGVIFGALVCTAMMAAMMFTMPGGNDRQ